jgi:hypothetical protein
MITYEDCLALADLAPETVDHVAARAGLTAIAAVGLASRLAATAEGGRDGGRTITAARPEVVTHSAATRVRVVPARPRTGRLAA